MGIRFGASECVPALPLINRNLQRKSPDPARPLLPSVYVWLSFTRRETSSEIIELLSSTKGFRLGKFGALERRLVEEGEKWRPISCIWLHGGLLHLLANMISLLCIGMHLEHEFGFYSRGERVSVGASGALFGLLGAMLSELIINWTIYENKCTSLMTLILIIALNLSVGFLPRVDNSAHCHCTEPKRRILTTSRQFCSPWRILSRGFPRVCPSSSSAVRMRESQVHSSWLCHETQEIKTQMLSTRLQVYISSHSSCGIHCGIY